MIVLRPSDCRPAGAGKQVDTVEHHWLDTVELLHLQVDTVEQIHLLVEPVDTMVEQRLQRLEDTVEPIHLGVEQVDTGWGCIQLDCCLHLVEPQVDTTAPRHLDSSVAVPALPSGIHPCSCPSCRSCSP